MTDKALYNIQNDIMDNNQSNLLREVEKEIHRSYNEDSDEQAIALLNATEPIFACLNNSKIVDGNNNIAIAKIIGITPPGLSLNGINEFIPP